MRHLFLLLGAPGSGKSTFIKKYDLESYTISTDNIRKLFLGETVGYVDGEVKHIIDNTKYQKKVFNLVYDLTKERMENGYTTFIDATNLNNKTRKKFLNLAKEYNYRLNVIPFGFRFDDNLKGYSTISLSELKERNKNRKFVVPEEVVERMFETTNLIELNKQYTIIYPEDFEKVIDYKIFDYSDFKEIKVIGDIHSCGSVLKQALKDFSEDVLYVFLGDYFDRGIETEKTLKIIDSLLDKDNVVFLEGNHEIHLRYFLKNKNYSKGRDFQVTKQHFIENDNRKIIKKLVKKLQPLKLMKFHDKIFVLSHAGFDSKQMDFEFKDNLKNELMLRPVEYFTKGIGGYENDVDKSFEDKFKDTDIYQIHGHRNFYKHSVMEFSHSFDLEQQVEYGNLLGILSIKKENGKVVIKDKSIKNDVFNEELNKEITVKKLENDEDIKVKELKNGIKVFNFTEQAFRNDKWTKRTISARGLFLNDKSDVVARGYDKFFNIGQKETLEDLAKQFSNNQLIEVSDKENGYLGIISYVPEMKDLLITSKGNGEAYSKLFEDILKEKLKENNVSFDDFKEYFKTELSGYSLTCEVVSSLDKHIVNYNDKDEIFMLNIIKNTFEEQDFSYNHEKLLKLNEKFHLPIVEKRFLRFENDKDFIDFVNNAKNEPFIEGYVLTNLETGKKIKLKTDWYLEQKRIRNFLQGFIGKILNLDKQERNIFLDKKIDMLKQEKPDNIFSKNVVSEKINSLEKLKEIDDLNNIIYYDVIGGLKIDIHKI